MTPYITGGAVIAAVLLFFLAASNRLKRRDYFLKSGKVAREITIAQISDLHESQFGEKEMRLLAMLSDAAPDLIMITGDTVDDVGRHGGLLSEDNPSRHLLEGAVKIAPCYMVFGNHERFVSDFDRLCKEIRELGVRLLHPDDGLGFDRAAIDVKGDRITVCGAADPYFSYAAKSRRGKKITELAAEDKGKDSKKTALWRAKITEASKGIPELSNLTILLSHRPEEYKLYATLGFDVILSGHAHGGQWRLPPLINGVYAPHQGIFPSHAGGYYPLENGIHIVSRGLSKKRMIRIFNRPEICIIKIVPEKG